MNRGTYKTYRKSHRPKRKFILWGIASFLLVVVCALVYTLYSPTPVEKAVNKLQFDHSVTEAEKQTIRDAIQTQSKTYSGSVSVSAETTLEPADTASVLAALVPVTDVYATRQTITKAELASAKMYVPTGMDEPTRAAIAAFLGVEVASLATFSSVEEVPDTAIAFIPASELTPKVKLLTFEGAYYLDSFQKGAIFRRAVFSGDGAADITGLMLNTNATKNTTLKVNMTGVTALTRGMMKKLASVKDPKYFSQKIGTFLADADITHVSNEVSFKPGCAYSTSSFCAPPEMIETLKDSGVDLVEITGNHNNDTGKQYNVDAINLYHSLGWHTFGGGLNAAEAAKPFITDLKNTKVAFFGYNYPDAPGGAVATASAAGANHFDLDKIKTDIATAKQQGAFVIVDIQFWECYSYPAGYVEFPECDVPIPNQKEVFRQVADSGADMVIGTQAHQPQTYEIYKDKPIYYGLGNLYFDQTQWPGTERGIILTHYFAGGKLLQTKLSPTVYHAELQTRLMDDKDAVKLLQRLKTARQTAGL